MRYQICNKKIQKENSAYLDLRRVIKFFPICYLYVLYGSGGTGKTTTSRLLLRNLYNNQISAIKNKVWTTEEINERKIVVENKFVWLNRTDTEVKNKKNDLFKDLGWFSIGQGNLIQTIVEIKVEGEDKKVKYALDLGSYEALNNATKIRGGKTFNEYTVVIWDEFLDENNNYLPNELDKFQSILHTVSRSKTFVKWFLLSNTVSKYNPIFEYFNFSPDVIEKNQQLYIPDKKTVFIRIGGNEKFRKLYNKSAIATVFGDTNYYKYRLEGDFVNDDNEFIENVPDSHYSLKYRWTVKLLNNYFSVFDYKNGLYFRSSRVAKEMEHIIPLTSVDAVSEGKVFRNVDNLTRFLYINWIKKRILFETPLIKKTVLMFLKASH